MTNQPRPFVAKQPGQCADGSPQCGGIKVGDLVVRCPVPALFDASKTFQRSTGKMYYELWYSHVTCYEAAKAKPPPRILPRGATSSKP